ncbi:MAG: nucleotidyltransferase domain-containing protein [Clostridia bacterium]|nr:nucleotidyltransferase domain-containing protein [Clostridia bacterium]
MVNDVLNNILDINNVTNDFREEVKNGFRLPLQDTINKMFETKPNYRYGGSLAKGTANKNSCDIDLLCYFDSDNNMSIEKIYMNVVKSLEKSKYYYTVKNSAICVTGDVDDYRWNISVDVVPGKYTSNDENKDVYLWCNKSNQRLKSNPEIQINKIKKSLSKDVIRIIKIYREKNNFNFKSFFLEIFAVDVVEQDYQEGDSLYDKLVKFCSHYDEIGIRKIYDPANSNNDIMNIHSSIEFQIIRDKIKELYESLLTNDEITIINCINGKQYDLDAAYAKDAKSHSQALNLKENGGFINLTCVDDEGKSIYSNQTLPKGLSINFYIGFPSSIPASQVTLVVSNSGYESINCKRGNEETTKKINGKYYRNESTSYNGNHYVQAIVKTTTGNKYYSRPFIVRIRDYE